MLSAPPSLVPVSPCLACFGQRKQVTETQAGIPLPISHCLSCSPSSRANLAVVTKKRDQGKTQEQNL